LSNSNLVPLILKGVQCWEDALEAYDQGLAGVVLSNHGGRYDLLVTGAYFLYLTIVVPRQLDFVFFDHFPLLHCLIIIYRRDQVSKSLSKS
jgi:isopentenyl diphosphate isomerase/L-lactate dehydrogenase-like FMN-dependent dehydrogenase